MRIRFLGTAAFEGIPALFCPCDICKNAREKGGREIRTRCGALVDGKIKLDFPPDSYMHLLRDGLDYAALKTLLITHTHSDHYALWDIMARLPSFANLPKDAAPLTVYGNANAETMFMAALGEERGAQSGRLRFQRVEPFEPFDAEGYTVTALKAAHMPSEQALFYMLQKDGKTLVYAHDTAVFPEETFAHLAGRMADFVSLDCTSGDLDGGSGHMGLANARKVKKRMLDMGAAKPDAVFALNHFSHNGHYSYEALSRDTEGEFVVAYDGLEIEF